jgi:hypothetical protein
VFSRHWVPSRLTIALLGVLPLVSCCSCGEVSPVVDAGADGSGTLDAEEAFVEEWAETVCRSDIEICLSGVLWESLDACVQHHTVAARSSDRYGLWAALGRAAEGGIAFDRAAADACLEQWRSTCVAEAGVARRSNLLASCNDVFYAASGGEEGSSCSGRLDCARGYFCGYASTGPMCWGNRACRSLSLPREPCQSAAQCDWRAGLQACAANAAGQDVCTPVTTIAGRAEGERCGFIGAEGDFLGQCASGLICPFLEECELPGGSSEACSSPSGLCALGLECVAGVCEGTSRSDDGGPCNSTCLEQAGLACDLATNTCRATDGSLSAPCDLGAPCRAPNRCPGAVCVAPPPLLETGADCATDAECGSSCCVSGSCVEPP